MCGVCKTSSMFVQMLVNPRELRVDLSSKR